MNLALIYDRVNKIGGAERLLTALHEIWPEAPLYSAIYNPRKAKWADNFTVRTSFIQYVKWIPHEFLPWLMPRAFRSFNLNGYDIILSVSSAEAKFINKPKKALHVNYCLTPTRYLWSGYFDYLKNPGFGRLNFLARFFLVVLAPFLRMADFTAASKIDFFLSISQEVQKRVMKYYRQKSVVIYPPCPIKNNPDVSVKPKTKEEFFLIVSRLVPYKKIELAINVFTRLHKKLVIVGEGSQKKILQKMAGNNIIFTGKIDDSSLKRYYETCQALIYPNIEDFGLAALEAQEFEKPVICRKSGGTCETVAVGKTGEVFETENELAQIIDNFNIKKYKQEDFKNNLAKFSREEFADKLKSFIKKIWESQEAK